MDLKNLKIDDIKAKILSMADKKTLIKFGIGIGSIVFFLIIYYSILNPIVQTKKVKLKEMMDKKNTSGTASSDGSNGVGGDVKINWGLKKPIISVNHL